MAEEKVLGAEEKVESPTISDVPSATEGDNKQDPALELKEMLETYKINSPEDFQGLLNDYDYHKKTWGKVGNENYELRQRIAELESQVSGSNKRYTQTPQYDEYGNERTQQVDLERLVGDTLDDRLNKFMTNYNRQQSEMAERYWEERSELESQPNWKNVQPYFDKAMQNPSIIRAMQSGRMTQEKLYNKLSERYLLSLVNNFVKTLPQDANLTQTGEVATQSNIPLQPTTEEEQKSKIKQAVEDKDPEKVLENMFPDNDPIFRGT